MTQERALPENEAENQPTPETEDIRDRVQTLGAKTSQLSESLERVEKDLKEAGGQE